MRCFFRWDDKLVAEVKKHIRKAVSGVNAQRYFQESNYTSAIIARLDGTAYEGEFGNVTFRGTMVSGTGRKCAEKKYGADFAITAELTHINRETRKKVILGQAKKGEVEKLRKSEKERLKGQITKMKDIVSSPVVLETPSKGTDMPTICSGNKVLNNSKYKRIPLDDFIVDRVMTCFHGNTNKKIVTAVEDSQLSTLSIIAYIK
ncbi:MAG: hypothetical protein WC955_06390 [Elusimicrobiota bacterium]